MSHAIGLGVGWEDLGVEAAPKSPLALWPDLLPAYPAEPTFPAVPIPPPPTFDMIPDSLVVPHLYRLHREACLAVYGEEPRANADADDERKARHIALRLRGAGIWPYTWVRQRFAEWGEPAHPPWSWMVRGGRSRAVENVLPRPARVPTCAEIEAVGRWGQAQNTLARMPTDTPYGAARAAVLLALGPDWGGLPERAARQATLTATHMRASAIQGAWVWGATGGRQGGGAVKG